MIHRDDAVEALYLATKRGPAGAYNIAAPGAESLTKLLDAAGKLHAPLLSPIGLELAAFSLRRSGLGSLSPPLPGPIPWGKRLSPGEAAPRLGLRAAGRTP